MNDTTVVVGWGEFWLELQSAARMIFDTIMSVMLTPWGQTQIFLLLVVFLAAHLAAKRAEPLFERWVRGLETTRQRLKVLVILLRRLRLVFFIAGSWASVLVLRAITWPSRSSVLAVAAAIATVWLVVSLIGRLVRNPLARRLLTVAVWLVAALQLLGLLPVVVAVLDAASISSGNFRFSLLMLVKAGIIVGVLLWIASLLSHFTEAWVKDLDDLSPSMRVLAGKIVRLSLFAIATLIGLQSLGLDLTSLTVLSGAIGLGIGFGLQKVVSNLISGIILLLDKSVKPGDVIEVGDTFGWIAKLGSRYVSVVTRDGREYLIPNEDLITSQVINWSHTDNKVRLQVSFGVSYEADPNTVKDLAVAAAIDTRRVLRVPQPVCHLVAYGESSVDYVLRFWVSDPKTGVLNVKSDVLVALWYSLKDNGIAIPYPHRDLHFREPVRVTMDATPPETKGPEPRSRGRRPRTPKT
ncbi:MAG TPA: mechanosensitive ion channel domain-containing protein [Devosiaceae bacterium]